MKKIIISLILCGIMASMVSAESSVSIIDLTQITDEVRGGTFIPFDGGGMCVDTHIPIIRIISPKSKREYININALGATLKKLDNGKIQGKFSPSYTFRIDSLLSKLQEVAGGWIISAKLPALEIGISSILDLTSHGKIYARWGGMLSLKFGPVKK